MAQPGVVSRGRDLWLAARWLGLLATAALVGSLLLEPGVALTVLWSVAIPLLPASFLISPALWRNVCPLATLNVMGNRPGRSRVPPERLIRSGQTIGMALLALMVPARRFAFNGHGLALAIAIVAIAVVAFAMGSLYDMKSGFCNAICPVLPVERLYGQSPLLSVGNQRCLTCTTCTPRGCIDIGATKSIPQVLGRARRSHAWMRTGFGAFAIAFPGFVLGYYMTKDGPVTSAPIVYATVLGWAAAGYLLMSGLILVLRFNAAQAMRLLAGAAVAAYYWFAAPAVAGSLGWPDRAAAAIRIIAFSLIAMWLLVAVWRQAGEGVRRVRRAGGLRARH